MTHTATDNRFTPFCGGDEAFSMNIPAEAENLHRAVRRLGMLPRTTPKNGFDRFCIALFAGLTAKAGNVITDGADLARAIGIEHATRALMPGDVSMEVLDRAPLMFWGEFPEGGEWCIAFTSRARAGAGKHFLARIAPRWDYEEVEVEKDGAKVKKRYRKNLLGLTVTIHHRDGEWGLDPRSEARAYWSKQFGSSHAVPSYGGRRDYDESRGIAPEPVE